MDRDKNLIAAMEACLVHARALLQSARSVQSLGHHNIAFHLAILGLEELGRRELIGVQSVAADAVVSPAWPLKHTQNHVQKLFWCFFGAHFYEEKLTTKALESITSFAKDLHQKRLEGLYVSQREGDVGVPSDAIQAEECEQIVALAEARLGMAASERLRENIPEEETRLQEWFLRTADDPDRRRQIFSSASLSKLAELKNAQEWARWLKGEFDKAEADGAELSRREIERSRNLPDKGTKDKWKLRVRIHSDSHSIRPKALTQWNKKVEWIKLVAVPEKKKQIIIEFILRDNVPIDALWYYGWGLARNFVVALNIGTMGFWWWRLPEQISRYYESIEDVDQEAKLRLERTPILKVDWGENRVLTESDLGIVSSCFAALPGPNEVDRHKPFNNYIGGLTFLSLNDVHWQCEPTAFGNFLECMKGMMEEMEDWKPGAPFVPVMSAYLDKAFPNMDEDRQVFLTLCEHFEKNTLQTAPVTLKEASFAKLFCDAYFLHRWRPAFLAKKLGDPLQNQQ